MRKFEPLNAEHPLVEQGTLCPACQQPFVAGDVTTLVTLGPGDSPDARLRRDEGRPYSAIALPIHWDCSAHAPAHG